MAVQNYEQIDVNTDVTTTRTLLHEVIPLTGTIVSGTYSDNNIKNYTHGMFQSVYDYPYLSSSANHIFDITCGFNAAATVTKSVGGVVTDPQTLSVSCATHGVQCAKKINTYNQFAQTLLGYVDAAGNTIETFESDNNIGDDSRHMTSCYFITLSRLIMKEQIKKGSFSMTLGTGSNSTPSSIGGHYETASGYSITIGDYSASATDKGIKSGLPGGEYGVLYVSGAIGGKDHPDGIAVGNVFYQAGVIVLTSSVFGSGSTANPLSCSTGDGKFTPMHFMGGTTRGAFSGTYGGATYTAAQTMVTGTISGSCDILRQRIQNISFNNTTEINSKIYFCRVPHNKYNYSSNPTYTKDSKIQVKNIASDPPLSYITTVGLYNSNNELLAVAKLSEPLRKDPTNELTLRVRLDY